MGFHALKVYRTCQKDEQVKKQNQSILQKDKFTEVYKEIDKILPSLEFCLAPRKVQALL